MQDRRDFPRNYLRDTYYVLFRHKVKVIVSFLFIVGIISIATLAAPRIYRSEAKLMVLLGRESVGLDPTATTGATVNIGQDRAQEVNSELQILRSLELIQDVVKAIGAATLEQGGSRADQGKKSGPLALLKSLKKAIDQAIKIPFQFLAMSGGKSSENKQEEFYRAVKKVMKNIHVEAIEKSNVIAVSYDATSPTLAQTVVREVVRAYLEKHIGVYRTTGSYDFFRRQAKRLQAEVQKAERAIQELKDEAGTTSLDGQQQIALRRVESLEQQLEKAQLAYSGSIAKIDLIQKRIQSLPKTVVARKVTGFPDSSYEQFRGRIHELQMKEQELLSLYSDTAVPVIEIRRQLAQAQSILAKSKQLAQVTREMNSAYQRAQEELIAEEIQSSSLRAETEALTRQLADARARVKELNEMAVRLAELQRDLDIKDRNYRKYTESLEQARIDQALETQQISNISVVQPASYPIDPIRPKTKIDMILGLILGVIGSISLAFFTEYLDHSFKRPEDVEKHLDLPVLASVPRWAGGSRLVAGTALAAATASVSPRERDWLRAGKPAISTSFQHLTERLMTIGGQPGMLPKPLAFTGCYPGDGVSTIAANVAAFVSKRNRGRVVVIEAGMERPTLHELFGVEATPGLADVLTGSYSMAEVVKATQVPDLDVVPAGTLNKRSAGAGFREEPLLDFVDILSAEYATVIVDLPALSEEDYSYELARKTKGLVMVLEAEAVRWEVAQEMVGRLQLEGVELLGVVLNKRIFHTPQWLYKTL